MIHRQLMSVCLAALLAFQLPLNAAWEQEQAGPKPSKLRLEIIEGDGAINNIKQRVSREPVVQVEDENRKPLAGAVVVFTLPERGASAAFSDGSRVLTVLTDENGRAVARGLQPNSVSGKMQIRVNASFRGVNGSRTIVQTNALTAGAAGGGAAAGAATAAGAAKIIAIVAVVGGAAAAGVAVAATRGGNNNAGPAGPTPTVISPGNPTVGPPR